MDPRSLTSQRPLSCRSRVRMFSYEPRKKTCGPSEFLPPCSVRLDLPPEFPQPRACSPASNAEMEGHRPAGSGGGSPVDLVGSYSFSSGRRTLPPSQRTAVLQD